MDHSWFIHSACDAHLGCFHCLAPANDPAMNKGIEISLRIPAFSSPEVELLDHMVNLFLIFLKKYFAVFHSSCIILHSHQQYTRVTISPTIPSPPHTTTQEDWISLFFSGVLCSLLSLDPGICSFLFLKSYLPIPKSSASLRSLLKCHFLWESFSIPWINSSYWTSIYTLFYCNTCHSSLLLESSSCPGQG